ncbi:MAG: hypothetical protein P4L83_20870, partial [Nevskia sp.]|nr:hypothetical protein [Nevskia sp.]
MLDWLAHEATRLDKQLAARTLGVYRSAISTWHEESDWAHLPNPVTSDPRVGRLLEGVKKTRRAVHFDEVRSATAQPTLDLTPQMLREMALHAARADSSRLAMLWAAVCLGTFGLLRMNELLGSPQHPERALRVAQVRFCRTPAGLPAPFPPEGSASTPDHFVVDLLATKGLADQHGANAPLSVAAPLAVTAMWRWSIARRSLAKSTPGAGTAPEYLFALPGEKSVTLRQITDYLKDTPWCQRPGRCQHPGRRGRCRRPVEVARHAVGLRQPGREAIAIPRDQPCDGSLGRMRSS